MSPIFKATHLLVYITKILKANRSITGFISPTFSCILEHISLNCPLYHAKLTKSFVKKITFNLKIFQFTSIFVSVHNGIKLKKIYFYTILFLLLGFLFFYHTKLLLAFSILKLFLNFIHFLSSD